MPYIVPEDRAKIDKTPIGTFFAEKPGDLNYALTRLCIAYLQWHGMKYQTMNDVVGALEGCKMEFYRQHVAPYEDEKIELNGDVT